jgi:methanogenic corrinoid protein MtbC1
MDLLDALGVAIVELDEDETLRLTQEILAEGRTVTPAILPTCQQAMRVVGERYERGEYYLAALILAGELFKEVSDLVQPEPVADFEGEPVGVILLGTVSGDIHDIGKNMFSQALKTFGFTVVDLGVDVPNEEFLEKAKSLRPDVVCLSGLISIAFESMKKVVDLLRAHSGELGYLPPVVIGGGTVDNEVCLYAGATTHGVPTPWKGCASVSGWSTSGPCRKARRPG